MATLTEFPPREKLPELSSHRIAALDGVRGIAILMVMEEHFFASTHPELGHWGRLGVTIFFVLSGYLITGNLLKESDRFRKIDLARFYVRRAFRLWPCAWAYLACTTLIVWIGGHRFDWANDLKCILFVRNFTGDHCITEHFWSLSIEEQFYLAWPLVLVFFRKRAQWIAISGIAAVAAYRWLHWSAWIDRVHDAAAYGTQFHADALLCGCLLAILAASYPHICSNLRIITLLLVVLLAVAILPVRLAPTAAVLAIALGILLIRHSPAANLALSLAPLAALGRISYSLYVWQELFTCSGIKNPLALIPLSLATAFVSYVLLERTGIRFGRRFSMRQP